MNLNQMSDGDLRKLRDLIDAQLAMRHPGLQLKQRAALFNEPFSVPDYFDRDKKFVPWR